jgi:HPt (histidine-containing phosphotransfer) domain-containing protein
LAVELLDMFAGRAARGLEAIDECVSQHDRQGLLNIAHALKGVAATLSAPELLQVTAKIDHDYRHGGDMEALLNDVAAMRSEVVRCLAALPPLRRSITDTQAGRVEQLASPALAKPVGSLL